MVGFKKTTLTSSTNTSTANPAPTANMKLTLTKLSSTAAAGGNTDASNTNTTIKPKPKFKKTSTLLTSQKEKATTQPNTANPKTVLKLGQKKTITKPSTQQEPADFDTGFSFHTSNAVFARASDNTEQNDGFQTLDEDDSVPQDDGVLDADPLAPIDEEPESKWVGANERAKPKYRNRGN